MLTITWSKSNPTLYNEIPYIYNKSVSYSRYISNTAKKALNKSCVRSTQGRSTETASISPMKFFFSNLNHATMWQSCFLIWPILLYCESGNVHTEVENFEAPDQYSNLGQVVRDQQNYLQGKTEKAYQINLMFSWLWVY